MMRLLFFGVNSGVLIEDNKGLRPDFGEKRSALPMGEVRALSGKPHGSFLRDAP